MLFLTVIYLCNVASSADTATFSPVLSDDRITPFGFTAGVYDALIVGSGHSWRHVLPLAPHMGVYEPFSGNPSGVVEYKLRDRPDELASLTASAFKMGKFFFLQLSLSSFDVNQKRQVYEVDVDATFTSESPVGSSPIRLKNTTKVRLITLDRNENCPFFSAPSYTFTVLDNTSIHSSFGQLVTTDADSGFNAQAFFYLDPAEDGLPIRIHPFTGKMYASRSLQKGFWPETPHTRNFVDALDDRKQITFKVYATHRGDPSQVRCNIVSVTTVQLSIETTDSHPPTIIVDPFNDISIPGAVGVPYARVSVIDKDSSRGTEHTLRILEPDMQEKFGLIPTAKPSEWLLQVRRNLTPISLAARIVLTLEAADKNALLNLVPHQISLSDSRISRYTVDIPVVSKSTYRLHFPSEVTVTITEAALVNCTIAILTPSLPYRMSNSSFVFTLLRADIGNDSFNTPIRITSSGSVVLSAPVDVDHPPSFGRTENYTKITLPFTVVDRNNLLLSSAPKSRLVVLVLDVNDNDPVVRNNATVYEIREDAPLGTVVFHIDAVDTDLSGTRLLFSLYNSYNLPFVVSDEGNLLVGKPLDAEVMPTEFTLYLKVTDSGRPLPRSVLAVFTVHILDVNEYAPRFVELGCETWLSVTEAGTIPPHPITPLNTILGRYSAEDIDRDGHGAVSIRLATSTLNRPCFKVDATTGELSVTCSYMGPPGSNIILTLLASDGDKFSDVPVELTIHLVHQKSNKNFTQRCQSSGVYTELERLKLRRKEYELLISSYLQPRLLSVNRHRPKFPPDLPTRIHVPENLPLEAVVLQLSAVDEDSGEYSAAGQIVYGLEALGAVDAENFAPSSGTTNSQEDFQQAFLLKPVVYPGDFSPVGLLYPKNGVALVVAAPLDRERISSFSLVIHACDLGTPRLCASSPLHIFLDDLDDNPPEFLTPSAADQSEMPESFDGFIPVLHHKASIPGVFQVPEDIPIDARIGQVSAVDHDVTDEVRYRLLSHTDVFKIHPRTGRIRLLSSLDRETQSSYDLVIEATSHSRRKDQQRRLLSPHYTHLYKLAKRRNHSIVHQVAVTRVRVTVTDINDNLPVFTSPGIPGQNEISDAELDVTFGAGGYQLFIPEDLPEGAYLTTLLATDADEGLNGLVGYSLFGNPQDADCFSVDQFTGVVRVAASCELVKHRGRSIYLTAWAFDRGTPQLTSNSSFVIHVVPVRINVFPPMFRVQPALFSCVITENVPSGTAVLNRAKDMSPLRLEAADPEGSDVTFFLAGGSGLGYFYIDDHGIVRNKRILDAESQPEEGGYWLTVYAVERPPEFSASLSGSAQPKVISTEHAGPMRSLAEVFIEVLDENDNYPIPIAPEFACEIPENSPSGLLVATVLATDADKNSLPLRYHISAGDPQGHFTIDSKSGTIRTTARPLDREAVLKETGTNQLSLLVSISDQGTPPKACEVRVLVTLLDVNDQTPKFIQLGSVDSIAVTDVDSPVYHFRVYESEQDHLTGCVNRVLALDLDDSVNGTVLYWRDTVADHLSAPYPDGGFDVKQDSGLICSDNVPLQSGEYRIRVYAKDLGQPARIANDNRPVGVHISVLPSPSSSSGRSELQFIVPPPRNFSLRGYHAVGHRLFTFAVADSLDPSGHTLTFSLSTANGTRHPPFGLGHISTVEVFVFLAERLDRSQLCTHHLVITVSNGYQRLVSKVQVTVERFQIVRPQFVVHEPPQGSVAQLEVADFKGGSYGQGGSGLQIQINVSESVLTGSLLCRLQTEPNYAEAFTQRTLEYSIVSVGQSATLQLFSLNQQTGDLRVIHPLDHESITRHYMLIVVRDSAAHVSSFVNMFVNVQDVNEHAPQFVCQPASNETSKEYDSQGYFMFFVVGTSPAGTIVGRVTAVDPDPGENGKVTYSIIGGNTANYFELDSLTGDVKLVKPLLPRSQPSGITLRSERSSEPWTRAHRLIVSAKDNGKPVSRSNHTDVWIRVVPGPGGIDAVAPKFRPSGPIHLSVVENCSPGHIIATISRFLTPESALFGFIHFELVFSERMGVENSTSSHFISSGRSPTVELFHVTPDSGLLVTLVSLDRERHGDLYRLQVRVRGSNGIRAEIVDYLTLEVQILDQNDNAPRISSSRFLLGQISEDARPGTLIMLRCADKPCFESESTPIQLLATDPDLGLNGHITFQFVGPQAQESSQLFTIDPANGLFRLAEGAVLDRESASHHLLVIQVSDSGSPVRTAENLVRIDVEVLDVNDSPPIFSEPFYMRTLLLPTYPSAQIVQLIATDPDLNDSVSYRIIPSSDADLFAIDSKSGKLSVAPNSTLLNSPTLQREYNFLVEVEAFDQHRPVPHSTHTNVTIFAQLPASSSGNDHHQTSLIIEPEGGLDVVLVEHYSKPKPLRLGQLFVRNAPVGAIYRFVVLTPISGLDVDSLTGTVLATGNQTPDELDREVTPKLVMHILVRDMHNQMGRGVVRIRLLDVNDHAPMFVGLPYHTMFCLNSVAMTSRPKPTDRETACRQNKYKVTAVDRDEGSNGSVTFSLASIRPRAEPPLLSINTENGELSLVRLIPPDWTGRQLEAVVLAVDGGGLSSSATVVIQLVSGDGPRFSASHYTATVPESASIGEAITTVDATSPSPSVSLIYRVVAVRATNHTLVSTHDSHNNLQAIEVSDSPFMLEFNTAIVRLIAPLDYETVTGYQLLLEALDTSTALSARVQLSISVTDVNDVAPRFLDPSYTLFVSEREPIGFLVLQLRATDPDSGYGGQITYSLESHHSGDTSPTQLTRHLSDTSRESLSYFECDEHTGQITLARNLNYQKSAIHQFWAIATDQAAIPLSSRIPITIHVLDYNDNAPQFDPSNYQPTAADGEQCSYRVKLNERAPPGTFVTRLLATDLDSNDTLRYRLVADETKHSEYFRLGYNDGILYWAPLRKQDGRISVPHLLSKAELGSTPSEIIDIPLDAFLLKVEVSDQLHTAYCLVHVEMEAVNYVPPSFPLPKHEVWNVSEGATHLGRIRLATDSDRSNFGKITYALVGGHGREHFRIESTTGDLFALELLDRETVNHYRLLIRAMDGGKLFDYMTLDLNILDVNDNRPQFTQSTYEITLLPDEYSPPMPHFPVRIQLYVRATDADLGVNARVSYRIFRPPHPLEFQSGFDHSMTPFEVDPQSGQLIISRALDDEIGGESQVLVEACDSSTATGVPNQLCSSPARIVIRLAKRPPDVVPQIACTSSSVLEDDHLLDRDVAFCQVRPDNLSGTWILTSATGEFGLSVGSFRIDPRSGHVYTTQPLDYERGRFYQLAVEFHLDNLKPTIGARTEFTLSVVDVNDCAPELDTPVYLVELVENTVIGTRITRILARDRDADLKDPITYSIWPSSLLESELLSQGDETVQQRRLRLDMLARTNPEVNLVRQQFTVDSEGWLILKSSLDFESTREHKLKVAAMDAVGHWNSSMVVISIIDVNDNAPHWPLKEIENNSLDRIIYADVLRHQVLQADVTVPENWLPDSSFLVYQLKLVDPDTQVAFTPSFFLLPETYTESVNELKANSFFSVSSSGAVQLRRPLDREQAAEYILKFRGSDGAFMTKDSFSLRVEVEDANDNAPICLQPERILSVAEDTKRDTVLTQLVAADADADLVNSEVSYRLSSGDPSLFDINSTLGLVQLGGDLDFETKQSHELSVIASDPGGLSCLFHVVVRVLDVNDNPPEFEPVAISPIPEDAPLGSLVGKVTARDRDLVDSNRLVYSLDSAHEASFTVEPHTGLLKVSRTLDRETQSVHTLTVFVTDGSPSSSIYSKSANQFTATTTFTIRLLDVNDSPPQFVNTSAHKIHVSELEPAGRHLTRLKAVSLDEGTNAVVRYRLLTKQPEFSLNETTGDLLLEGKLDHERASSYFLTVEARDHGDPPLSTTAVVTVTVDDVNDNRPQFVGRQLLPESNLVNEIIPDRLKDLLAHFYSFTVVENSRNGTLVGRLQAVDADSGENGRLSYHLSMLNSTEWMSFIYKPPNSAWELLSPSEVNARFQVDPKTGRLTLLFEPDRELMDEYWLTASVADHGSPKALTSQTLIRVRVQDINDCPPVFEKPNYEFIVEVDRAGGVSGCHESQPANPRIQSDTCQAPFVGKVLVGRLRITDADADPNAGPFTCQLTHSGSVQSGSDGARSEGLFSVRNSSQLDQINVTMSTGECLLYAVDQLPVGSQSLILRATDNGLTALHASVTVTIRVVRQANLPPEIVRGNATLTYYRGSTAWQHHLGSTTTVVGAIDDLISNLVVARVTVKDRTAHDRLTFELIPSSPSASLFRVDRYDGTIRSAFTSGKSDAQSVASFKPTDGAFQDAKPVSNPMYSSLATPLSRLDSGLYPLRIRVSNGTLASEEVLYIQVVSITDEMLESATVIRISNLLPNLFYMENYDRRLRAHLASALLSDVRTAMALTSRPSASLEDNVYILSVQEADHVLITTANSPYHNRIPRSLDRAVDVLIAAYHPEQREFIKPPVIAQAVQRISGSLSAEFNGKVEVIYDVCTVQFCPRGRCFTRITIDPNGVMNRIEVHRVSQVSPRFSLSPTCRCPRHFTGLRCDTPLNGCALAACPSPRICVPHGANGHVCICPPPRTGPNCESVQAVGLKDPCYSERCFKDREHGPLQFTGGSLIQWELLNPNPHHLELSFGVRTRQSVSLHQWSSLRQPLLSVRWSALRAFQFRLATGGRLVVSATGLKNGMPEADWLVSAEPVSDGHWHRVRLVLTSTSTSSTDEVDTLLFDPVEGNRKPMTASSLRDRQWWVELTIDGIHPRSASIDWDTGDPVQQGLLIGADPVHGFGPLVPPFPLVDAPVIGRMPQVEQNHVTNGTIGEMVLRSGIVGCFRDIQVSQSKLPYQINYPTIMTEPRANPTVHSYPTPILVRALNIDYGCDPGATISGGCASGPCLHGGTCTPGSQPGSTAAYTCHCPALFHGHHCERTSDACLLQPCQNGGSCQALLGPSLAKTPANSGLAAYRCVCPAGVSGLHCELLHETIPAHGSEAQKGSWPSGPGCHSARLILQYSRLTGPRISPNAAQWIHSTFPLAQSHASSSSSASVCLNSGVCLESPSGPYCSCPAGWQGARCEHDVNECQLADLIFSRQRSSNTPIADSVQLKLSESHGVSAGGLCSPFEVGRGVCVNTPGSYQCNCSLGFGGRYCQTKTLIPITPDPNALGLTQLHIYVIVGLLAFLFLAALTTIVLLACRARGFFGSIIVADARTSKTSGSYLWSPRDKRVQSSHKPPAPSPDPQHYRYPNSDASSLAGVPFLAPSPRHPVHSSHFGTHSSCHGFPSARIAHRRPSLASSTFAIPCNIDDSTMALLSGHADVSKRGSGSSAAATVTDYVDREDSSAAGTSRLLLYPTSGGEPVPVVMMMSPTMPYAGSVCSVSNRASAIPHHSPASSMLFYGHAGLSGAGTPTNQGSSSYIGYNVEPPGSACVVPRQFHPASQMAFYQTSTHATCLPQPQSHHQHPSVIGLRPNSVAGSDRLSLGSGSDRFSAHGSQILIQSTSNGPSQLGHYHPSQAFAHHPLLTPQVLHPSRIQLAQHASTSELCHPGDPTAAPMAVEATGTLRPENSNTLKPKIPDGGNQYAVDRADPFESSPTRRIHEYQKPRPLPANLHHSSGQVSNQSYTEDLSAYMNGDPGGDATPTLCKVNRPPKPLDDNTVPFADEIPLAELKVDASTRHNNSAFQPHHPLPKPHVNSGSSDQQTLDHLQSDKHQFVEARLPFQNGSDSQKSCEQSNAQQGTVPWSTFTKHTPDGGFLVNGSNEDYDSSTLRPHPTASSAGKVDGSPTVI
ncbi:hypothetical protein CRM22_008469 [Opisthorchis felineus]|uniref:Protocadherin Fat 1 n=1 Tax=Opisthorchis felineus TaxID=147828 RepID=A0A4S2LHZ6_OPIFE|nr:hypothetical protein CRM22_008469 [Opisthorchis felineus]